MLSKQGVIRAYRSFFDDVKNEHIVTLGEGNTPLVPTAKLARLIHLALRLWCKFEGANPTGSFKDRGMTVAMSKAVQSGAQIVGCASTGNTSASCAAYAARAGLRCIVLLPAHGVARGKLAQARMYNVEICPIEGTFDDAQRLLHELAREAPIAVMNSTNPDRLAGQRTAAFEIIDELHFLPDYHFIPVGNGGNITAYWMGYREYLPVYAKEHGRYGLALPAMMGWEAEGAAPLVLGIVVANPQTVASAIRIGNPAHRERALAAARESGGRIGAVSDDEILEAQRLLAKLEGIFCEPASAASVAGLMKCSREGLFDGKREVSVVCTLTGHGLKDPDAVDIGSTRRRMRTYEPSAAVLRKALKL